MSERNFLYTRVTQETSIELELNLDGQGTAKVDTGIGFADHMFSLMAFWGRFDLNIRCAGDLHIDTHHTIEDLGLSFGHALNQCLGDKKGLTRMGWARVPMDEALAEVTLDLSGRPYIIFQDDILPLIIAGDEKDVWREFFKSIAFAAKMNLHIDFPYGQNGHHLIEAAAKAFGLALAQAVTITSRSIPSTKGTIE